MSDEKPVAEPALADAAPAAPATESATEQPKEELTEAPKEEPKDEEAKPEAAEAAEETKPETPLAKFQSQLPKIIFEANYAEMWGVPLNTTDAEDVPTQVVLQKFLRANSGDAEAAEKQLLAALKWRAEVQPAKLVEETFDRKKFADLGYVTVHEGEDGKETVITWNVYGAVKDNKTTFGDVKEFIKWRAALMELSVQKLNLNAITTPVPSDPAAEDPYQMIQVHDYKSVSFFKMDPHVKAASKETIQTFSTAYPELLAHKYFVNVPTIMGWMYAAMKLFLAPATLRKFHPMRSGTTLAAEMPEIKKSLPKEYGGEGPPVTEGMTVKLADVEKPAEAQETKEATAGASKADEAKDETKAVEPSAADSEAKAAEEVKAEEPSPSNADDKKADN